MLKGPSFRGGKQNEREVIFVGEGKEEDEVLVVVVGERGFVSTRLLFKRTPRAYEQQPTGRSECGPTTSRG